MVSSKKISGAKIPKAKGGKRIRQIRDGIDDQKIYPVSEGVSLVKSSANAKFDETMEVSIRLGVDPKHSDQMVRGVVAMPHGTGKTVRVAVFAKAEKAEEATKAGADLVGSDDLLEAIKAGNINFDRCIATPDMMAALGSVAKILGPRGLMPNPKLGTVTVNVADAVKAAKSGQVEYRVEKAGIVHVGFGKVSFDPSSLLGNLRALMAAILKAKPAAAKGTYVKSAYVSSTMGGSCRLDVSELINLE